PREHRRRAPDRPGALEDLGEEHEPRVTTLGGRPVEVGLHRAGGRGEGGGLFLQDHLRASSMATSSIRSSCPPTVLRRPISTRISRAETPCFSPARLANRRNDE